MVSFFISGIVSVVDLYDCWFVAAVPVDLGLFGRWFSFVGFDMWQFSDRISVLFHDAVAALLCFRFWWSPRLWVVKFFVMGSGGC
jgi:hypothetical protein